MMHQPDLKSTLQKLGLKQVDLARLLDVSPRTINLWATGATSVPGPAVAYLRILEEAGPAILAKELRHARRPGLLHEGVYELDFEGQHRGAVFAGRGTGILRNGKIVGSDHGGGVFDGSYEYDAHRGVNRVRLRLKLPPAGMLVNGYAAGLDGGNIEIEGSFRNNPPDRAISVDVAGRRIDVRLSYLGPAPGEATPPALNIVGEVG